MSDEVIEEGHGNLDDLNLDSDTSEAEELTAAEVIKLMEEAWTNEKFAPEVLPHKIEIVECLLSQITSMEDNLENLESTDFTKSLYLMEVDRLRYLLSSYLRHRLEKIETFCSSILKQEEARIENNQELYLTDSELLFAREYKVGLEEHFEKVLRFWPGRTTDDWKREHINPNMYSFVFLKSKAEIEGIVIDDGKEDEGDLVDFNPGSQMIISYNSVANLVKKGDVMLI